MNWENFTSVYEGKLFTAENALEYIDAESMMEGIIKFREVAENLEDIKKKIQEAREFCTRKDFSIEDQNMEDILELCQKNYQDLEEYIIELSEKLESAVLKAYNKKQTLLNTATIEQEKAILARTGN